MKKYILPVFLIFLMLISCREAFEYHPNQIILKDDEKNLTRVNLARLQQQTPGDTVRILAMGDTQNFYDDVTAFVKAANELENIDFVVHQGDISDFGLVQEYRWIHDILKNLEVPYFTVIGNHDLLANGRKGYLQMFGDLNYSFVYGSIKFVFTDTNGREYGFNGSVPDIGWLEEELNPEQEAGWKQAVIISHMSPFSGDFDPQLIDPYHKTLSESRRVLLSLNGHEHNFKSFGSPDGKVTYHVTTTVSKRGFSLIKLWDNGYHIEEINY